MKAPSTSTIAGIALILAGLLLLLDAPRLLDGAALVWPVMFAAGGAFLLAVFLHGRGNWWAAIPGSVLLGLAALTATTALWPGTPGGWPASLFFLFVGAGFGAVFLREPSNWWAVIPSGVMLTLAVVVALPPWLGGTPVAAVLLLGVAATFAALALVPVTGGLAPAGGLAGGHPAVGGRDAHGRMKWPLIPAAVLAVTGASFALLSTVSLHAMEYFTAIFPLLAGLYLLFYAFRSRRSGRRHAGGPVTDRMNPGTR